VVSPTFASLIVTEIAAPLTPVPETEVGIAAPEYEAPSWMPVMVGADGATVNDEVASAEV
jgi:hypothetical protein